MDFLVLRTMKINVVIDGLEKVRTFGDWRYFVKRVFVIGFLRKKEDAVL